MNLNKIILRIYSKFFILILILAFIFPFIIDNRWAVLCVVVVLLLAWLNQKDVRHILLSVVVGFGFFYHGFLKIDYADTLNEIQFKREFYVTVVDYCLEKSQFRYLVKDNNSRYFLWLMTQSTLHYGDVLQVQGVFKAPKLATNPGQFDERSFFYTKHRLGYIKTQSIQIISKNGYVFKKNVIALKQHVLTTFRQWMVAPYADFLVGLVYGQHGTRLPKELLLMFKSLGLTHLLVVSGTQVSIVSGIVYCLFRRIITGPAYLFLVIVVTNLFFYMLTGGGASIVRSCLMNCAVVMGAVFHYRFSTLHVLFFTALIMLLIDPLLIYDIGFQLSFLATLSLVWGIYFIESKTLFFNRFIGGEIVMVSLLPFVFTLPVLIMQFSLFNPLSILANCLFVPIVEPLVSIGFFFTFLSFLSPLVRFGFKGLEYFLSVYLSLLTLIQPYLSYPLNLKSFIPHFNQMRLTFLDVGQGDASVIETPSGYTVLVDTGNVTRGADNVSQVIVPFLNHAGYSLDALVVTHYDRDHCAGVDQLLLLYPDLLVIDNGFSKVRYLNHKPIEVKQRFRLKDGVVFDFLYPNRDVSGERKNNRSVVLKVTYKSFDVLFTGDLEREGERELVQFYGDYLDSDVYQVGHHGSNTSSSYTLMKVLTPDVSVISAGKRNRYGHPTPQVLSRLFEFGEVYRTDIKGAISVSTNGYKYSIFTYL